MPLIIFAYMYQVNIPLIYYELERRNAGTMAKVLVRGSLAAVVLYAMVGVFGYLTFVHTPDVITQNIFEAPYGNNTAIIVGQFTLFFAVVTAAPLCVLPAKDTVEELFFKEKGLNTKANGLVTLSLVSICFLLSISIDTIGDAITLAGATINPVIGFIIPIMFYWKVRTDLPTTSI
jgi:sodium-coupled neutral amino acid transporter 11